MREIALAARVENKKIIEFLQTNITPRLDFCKNIITNFCDNNFCYLLFACEEEFVRVCEELLREAIIDYIENVYKVEFLKDSIKNLSHINANNNPNKLTDTLGFNAYIKVLSVFDKVTDENALKDIILFNQTFFIDSFLEFRLNPLKQHWLNLASLSSDNMTIFNSGTFVEVIRFLINTMDNCVYKLKVVCEGDKFKIYIMKNEHDKVKKIGECTNNLDLVTNVINSCPNYIDVYVSCEQENEAVNFLSNIFTSRMKIYSKTVDNCT